MKPCIISRSAHTLSRKWISPNALRVLYRLKERGYYAYLVGGGVRDLLLGREPKDFDIATDATPGEIKKIFRNCRLIGRRFRLAHIFFHDEIIEVATFRSSEPEEPEIPEPVAEQPVVLEPASPEPCASASPPPVRKQPHMVKTEDGMILRDNLFGTPEDDAVRRDFTVNALFYNIADFSVIDYVNGMDDLKQGLIRIIGDPQVRFVEDPVRIVRAARFAALLGFEIEEKTYQAMVEHRDKIALSSPARLYEEIPKLFLSGEAEKTYQLLRKTGIFSVLFPRIGEWLDTEAEGFPHIRIGKALERVDADIRMGRQISPPLLFALMFGQYLGEKESEFRSSGVAPLVALDMAIAAFLSEQSSRVLIPRKAALAVRDILWNQKRFERTGGRYPSYFLTKPGFDQAFEYFRFMSELKDENKNIVGWWNTFIAKQPVVTPVVTPKEQKPVQAPPAPSRRRRRRTRRDPQRTGPKPS